jgi:hypothetical protein
MMRRTKLELAAEHLLMAGAIEFAAAALPGLPVLPGTEAEDPRAELVAGARVRAYEGGRDRRPAAAERDFALVRVWFERVAETRLPESVRGPETAWQLRARAAPPSPGYAQQLSVRSQMAAVKLLEPDALSSSPALNPTSTPRWSSVSGGPRARARTIDRRHAGGALCADLRATQGRSGVCAAAGRIDQR